MMANSQILDSELQPPVQEVIFSNEQLIERIGALADQALFTLSFRKDVTIK